MGIRAIHILVVCLAMKTSALPGVDAAGPGGPDAAGLPAARPSANDWPWWRGPNRDDVAAADQQTPTRWSASQNVIWKSDIPGRGHSTPCTWGERIFLSVGEGDSQVLLGLDRATGKLLWRTELNRGRLPRLHPKNSHASGTPACDGQFVFVNLVHHDAMHLAAVSMDGKIAWQTRLGPYTSMHGPGASPAVWGPLVLVACDSVKDSFLCGVHRRSGKIIWKTPRPSYRLGTYSSLTVGRVAGRDQLLIHGPYKIYSHDPLTGTELWTCDGPDESASNTITLGRDVIYAAAGFPGRNLLCVRADGKGDVTGTHVVWEKKRDTAYVPSLLLHEGLLYQVEDKGTLTVFDAATGKTHYEHRLEGNYSSSPVLAGGLIYVVNEKGLLSVFKPGRSFELVARNDLADGGFATPVFLGGRLYLRTLHGLWCIGQK